MQIRWFNRAAFCFFIVGLIASCSSSDSNNGQGGNGGGTGGVGTGGASVPHGSGGSGSGGAVVGTGGQGTGGATQGSGGTITGTGGRPGTGGSTVTSTPVGTGGAPMGGTSLGGRDAGAGGRTGGATGAGGAGTGGGTGAGGQTGSPDGGAIGGSQGLAGPAVPSDGCGKATTAKSGNNQTIKVGSSNRTYNLKIPDSYDMNKPYKLFVSYHWLNGTAANVSDGSTTAAAWYGQNTASTSNGTAIFVAPQGLNNGWSNSGGADVEFSRQLITQLESQLCIDKARIFCEGFSMGGSMSYAMASAAPDIIRAVAVHSGGAMSGTTAGHNKPVAYFMTHGTKDTVCTWADFGLPQLQDFAKVDGCTKPDPSSSATALQSALPQPTSTQGVCLDFTGCKEGYPVRSCLFVGPHTPSPDGTTGWVPKESWKFFSQF